MSEHDFVQLFGDVAADHEQLRHGDEMGDAVPDGGDARDGVAVPDHLDEAAGSARGLRDGIQGQRNLRHGDGLSGGEQRLGGLSDAHDLGAAVDAGRHRAGHVRAVFLPQNAAGDVRALMIGGMGQQGEPVHIADGVHAFGGQQMFVHVHEASAFQRAARLFAVESGGVRGPAHGDQRPGGGQHASVAERQFGLSVPGDQRFRHHARDAGAARLAERTVQFLRNIGVFRRRDVRRGLHDDHLRAHQAEEVAEFEADGPRAHDDQAFRHLGKVQDAGAVEHGVAVGSQSGEGRAGRTAGQDDVVSRQHLFARFGADRDLSLSGDDAASLIQRDASGGQGLGEGLARSLEEATHAGLQRLVVDVDGTLHGPQAFLRLEHGERSRCAEQHLGGDAAAVQAGAAPVLVLDDRDPFAARRQFLRRRRAAGAAADNEYVVVHELPRFGCLIGGREEKLF